MSTFQYGGNTYTAIYVDISAGSDGNGVSPATPRNVYPTTISTGDAWILRRTAYNAAKVIPSISSAATSFMIIGCPRAALQSPFGKKDKFYDIVPTEVISAWGNDAALWAYFTSGGNNINLSSCYSFAWSGLKVQRTAGTSATTNYIVNITNNNGSGTYSNIHTEVYTGECSFGRYGEDVDNDGTDSLGRLNDNNATVFSTQIANDGLFQYLKVRDCAQASFENNLINYGAGSSTGGYGFWFQALWKFNLVNTVVNKVTGCDDIGVFYLNDANEHKLLSCNVINYTEHIIVNGTATSCNHIPFSIAFVNQTIDYLTLKNINIDMPRVLGTPNRTGNNLFIYNGLLSFDCWIRYCDIQDIDLDLNKVWYYMNQNGMPFRLNVYGTVGYVAGAIRKLKNITIQMGEDPAVAYGTANYNNNDATPSYYNVFYLDCNNSDIGGHYHGACPITVDNIIVNNERGKAAFIGGAQVTNASFKGQVHFGNLTRADVDTISSWRPSNFIRYDNGCTIHIDTVTANVNNVSYPYDGSTGCIWGTGYGTTIIVDHCNTYLLGDNKTSANESYSNFDYLQICKSAMEYSGNINYFMADSYNQYARSSNIYRTGGSPASIMFINQYRDNVTPMILGRSPLLGPQITVETPGRYRLSYYVAAKGYANLTAQGTVNNYIGTRFKIKVRVPQDVDGDFYNDYYSNTCGVYKTDATSEWNNETGLTMWRIDTYIDCPTTNPLSVEFEFNWYGAAGCKFLLDPLHELVSA
ncbi:MAG: hypothetical protein M0P71_01170 [Melioribacteraceae bacterium]|nr:hypothetical protein [Melioribacteraceae bacterium]